MDQDKLFEWILKITVGTLSLICAATVFTLLFGLFQNDVSNEKIFEVIGPAFNTVVGAFVGLLGGLSINKGKGCDRKDKE